MAKTLSLIALMVAVTLAACQPKADAPAPIPPEPVNVVISDTTPTPTPPPSPMKETSKNISNKSKLTKKNSTTKTTTPRLDDALRRIERLENLARSYGAQL